MSGWGAVSRGKKAGVGWGAVSRPQASGGTVFEAYKPLSSVTSNSPDNAYGWGTNSNYFAASVQVFMKLPYEQCTEAKVLEFLNKFNFIPIINEIQERIMKGEDTESVVDYEEKYYELKNKIEEIYKVSCTDEDHDVMLGVPEIEEKI